MNKKVAIVIAVLFVAFGIGYFVSQSDKTDSNTVQKSTVKDTESTANGVDLDLSGQQLTSLPDSVTSRTDVKSLNISNNQLTGLPASIANMKSLEVLNIENNRIESLPAELSELKNLQQILANNNRMTSVPAVLSNLTWLESLDISGNDIPESDITVLKSQLPNTQIKP